MKEKSRRVGVQIVAIVIVVLVLPLEVTKNWSEEGKNGVREHKSKRQEQVEPRRIHTNTHQISMEGEVNMRNIESNSNVNKSSFSLV